jgi:hypothetical protein
MSNESPLSSSNKSNKQLRQKDGGGISHINPPSLRLNSVTSQNQEGMGGGGADDKGNHYAEVLRINGLLGTTIEDLD